MKNAFLSAAVLLAACSSGETSAVPPLRPLHCSEVETPEDVQRLGVEPRDGGPSSKQLFDNMSECLCSGVCAGVCYSVQGTAPGTWCHNLVRSPTCQGCAESPAPNGCAPVTTACDNDVP